jgi:23S rRNA (uracil1939-C5)-methyltransferase
VPEQSEAQQKFDLCEVTIERILPGGRGIAYADGRTVMVALAAPGDRLRVRFDRVKGSVAFASIVEILEPSPQRVEPPCPYFGRCGGCDFQQLDYQAQLDAKVEIIRDCLRRLGGIEDLPKFEITRAPNEWRYRARAQWQYDAVVKRLGYFEANSHRVCDVAECAVLTPELQSQLERLRQDMANEQLPEDARYFRVIAGDEEVSVARGSSPTNRGPRAGSPRGVVDRGDAGARDVKRTIHGATYHLNAESFFQTNIDLLPQLIDAALSDAEGNSAIELYSGVGLFTVPLARQIGRTLAIEDDADATRFARQNLANAGLKNTQVVNADVGDWLDENLECAGNDGALDGGAIRGSKAASPLRSAAALQNIDFLLLDPPRTGVESRVISGIIKMKPRRISYVSCDPATLARDLKKLIAGGYSIQSIHAFDMFPQTHHVETVVQLSVH